MEKEFIEALKYCIEIEQVSASIIQCRFPIGYIESCKAIDWMEEKGHIIKDEKTGHYRLVITKDEFNSIYGNKEEN